MMRNVARMCFLIMVAATGSFCTGCGDSNDPLDIGSADWTSLSVRYAVGVGSDRAMKNWSTSDRSTLKRLQRVIAIKEAKPLSLVSTMTTNKISIELSTGKRIEMYILDDGRLTMHDPDKRRNSYSLTVEDAFVQALRAQIAADTGHDVRFYDSHR